jgi:hypothetical protein
LPPDAFYKKEQKMKEKAEHHGIEPEPRARPCPSAIDGMLHIYRIVSGIAFIDFVRSIKEELLDLAVKACQGCVLLIHFSHFKL